MLQMTLQTLIENPNATFQWAPTLGGECYDTGGTMLMHQTDEFQWAPTLGGDCYKMIFVCERGGDGDIVSMGTHPWG